MRVDVRLILTELADEKCLLGVRSPFPVRDHTALVNVQAKTLVSLGELVISAFIVVNGSPPLLEATVAMCDGRQEGLEPSIEVKDLLRVERVGLGAGHGRRVVREMKDHYRESLQDYIRLRNQLYIHRDDYEWARFVNGRHTGNRF